MNLDLAAARPEMRVFKGFLGRVDDPARDVALRAADEEIIGVHRLRDQHQRVAAG